MTEGTRVYTYDIDGTKCHGTLHRNVGWEHISEWYIRYDDGEEFAVVCMDTVYLESPIDPNAVKCCEPAGDGFYLGMGCPHCGKPFRNNILTAHGQNTEDGKAKTISR